MSTLLNLLALLKTNSRTALTVVLCLVSAFCAYRFTQSHYEAKISAFKAQMATTVSNQRKEYEQRISEATSRYVLASRRADANRVERDNLLDRLRVANARISERADSNPDRSYRAEYARCRKFLEEGAELASEGSELVGRIATEKDALSEIVK